MRQNLRRRCCIEKICYSQKHYTSCQIFSLEVLELLEAIESVHLASYLYCACCRQTWLSCALYSWPWPLCVTIQEPSSITTTSQDPELSATTSPDLASSAHQMGSSVAQTSGSSSWRVVGSAIPQSLATGGSYTRTYALP